MSASAALYIRFFHITKSFSFERCVKNNGSFENHNYWKYKSTQNESKLAIIYSSLLLKAMWLLNVEDSFEIRWRCSLAHRTFILIHVFGVLKSVDFIGAS